MSHPKTLVHLLICFGVIGLCAQDAAAKKWKLRWKIGPKKPLAYKTNLDAIPKPKHIAIPLKKLATGGALPPGTQKQLRQSKPAATHSIVTVMQATDKQKIRVKMIQTGIQGGALPKKHAKQMRAMMRRMLGTVQLRGDITPAGKILSFYLKNRQKNILALLFELPQKPVKVGDSWSLHANLLGMGVSIRPIEAHRTNRATLLSVKKSASGERIATIYTCISETFRGIQSSPYQPKDKTLIWQIGFVGYGEFLIDKGRWKQYVGRMVFNTSGFMTRKTQSRFELLPMTKVPPKLLKIK